MLAETGCTLTNLAGCACTAIQIQLQIQVSLLLHVPDCNQIPCLNEARRVHSVHGNDKYSNKWNDKYKTAERCKYCSEVVYKML